MMQTDVTLERLDIVFLDPEAPVAPSQAPVPVDGRALSSSKGVLREDDLWDLWLAARDDWLAAKHRKTGSDSTRRAYAYAWADLFERFLPAEYGLAPNGRSIIGPWQLGKTHVTAYQRALEDTIIGTGRNAGQPLAPTTINARLAAISSYYSYCSTMYTIWHQGREIPLASHNPAKSVERAKVTPYGKSHALGPIEVRDLLAAINTDCLRGKRDRALLTCYIFTGRRASEITTLRWGDIGTERGSIYYHWHGKGGKTRRDELPMPAYTAILDYLAAAERLQDIQPEDYIWTALSDNATRLPHVNGDYNPDQRPISTGMANRIVKTRARRAGLNPDLIHTHTLRHTAAMLRREVGDDPQDLQQFLAHSNLAVTQIYLDHREIKRDHSWSKVEELLQA